MTTKTHISRDTEIDTLIAKAKRYGKRIELPVAGCPGLKVNVTSKGTVSYIFNRRVEGRKHALKRKLGRRPALTLAMAKEKFRKILRELEDGQVALGIAPAGSGTTLTFKQLAEKRFESGKPLTPETEKEFRRQFKRDVYAKIGDLPIAQIRPEHIIEICLGIAKGSARISADRTRAAISSVFRYGVEQRLIQENPCANTPKLGTERARDHVPSTDDMRLLWLEMDRVPISDAMRLVLKICILTGQRRGTVVGARKSELIDLETDNPMWRIAEGVIVNNQNITRTKNGRSQAVPLSSLAVDCFRRACALSEHDEYVFPSPRIGTTSGHIDPHSVSAAMKKARAALNIKELRVHDFRRFITTELADLGVPDKILDMILHHTDGSARARNYDRAKRERQLRHALELWDARLREVAAGRRAQTKLSWNPVAGEYAEDNEARNRLIAQLLANPRSRAELEAQFRSTSK